MNPVSTNAFYKQKLAAEFGNAAAAYDCYATVQRQCADELVSLLSEVDLPDGAILELGCGTGFVTRKLIHGFPTRSLEITDLSEDMVAYCRERLESIVSSHSSISFYLLDGEKLRKETMYGAIASGFVVQWFEDIVQSLKQLSRALRPGGRLVASFPTNQSFPEWRQICDQLSLPFTGNPMPDVDRLCQQLNSPALKCTYQARWISMPFDRSLDFFRGLKLIGASLKPSSPFSTEASPFLTPRQLHQLVQKWDAECPSGIKVSYHVAFLVIQRL